MWNYQILVKRAWNVQMHGYITHSYYSGYFQRARGSGELKESRCNPEQRDSHSRWRMSGPYWSWGGVEGVRLK